MDIRLTLLVDPPYDPASIIMSWETDAPRLSIPSNNNVPPSGVVDDLSTGVIERRDIDLGICDNCYRPMEEWSDKDHMYCPKALEWGWCGK